MKNKIKKFLVSFTCVLLACVMVFMTACSSVPQNEGNNPPSSSDSPVSGGGNNEDSGSNNGDNNTPVKPSNPDDTVFEDYELNEAENFVYSLIYSDLTKQYDTFTGYVTLQSNARSAESVEVYGISYVDYEEGYIDESGKTYFSAGFISFPGEPVINQANIDAGLEIVSLEEEYDELFSYVYTYTTEDVHMHCVIDNKYVKYDVVDGVIQYEEEPYVEGMDVDFTRGNIYSYDIEDYVYIVEEQDYVPVSGVSLLGEADYQDIIDEVNRILQTQEANLTYAEIESYVSQSQDALYSYLLGLQEETFMGIPTAELVDIVRDLDPMQHLQIGVDANGTTTIEIIEVTKLPSLWEKIVTSHICSFGIVGGFVCNAVGCPVIGGALIGASMEVFSQVVISNTPVSDIQWAQVAVATVSGAIAGGVSGAINGIATKGVGQLIMKEVADTLCDSVIGGGEFFVNSLIAGCSFEEACKNFGYGVISGAVISGGIKIGSAAIKGGAKLIKKATTSTISAVGGKQLTKLGTEAVEDGTSELQEKAIQKAAKKNAKESIDGIMHYYDEDGNLYRIGKDLSPNNEYVKNGYKYITDDQGRVMKASGELHLDEGTRLSINDSMDDIGKGNQLITDQRGHLIADRFGGSNGLENIVPQNGKLNQGQYKALENEWARALSEGKKVSVDIELLYRDGSFRPFAFEINYVIDGKTYEVIFRN